MNEYEGTVLVGDRYDPIQGRVVVEDGRIAAVEETGTDATNIVVPAFVNAHTHVGDSVAKEGAVGLGLQEAVAPPDSRKHQLLAAADRADHVEAMRRTLLFMRETGTLTTLDFRENGLEGARKLRAAAEETPMDPFIFGSGDPEVLSVADGYGASGANDDDFSAEREAARDAGVPFAIHAGEPDPTDIDPALDLDPDLLVHMIHTQPEHFAELSKRELPVAVCPRANTVLGVGSVPLSDLLDHTTVALGTDNVMLNSPSMFREMAYTAKHFDVTAREVLRMATRAGAKIAGLDCGTIATGRRAALVVLDGDSHNLANVVDPVEGVVRRAGANDVKEVVVP